jgi:HK97 family phage major capsid protein
MDKEVDRLTRDIEREEKLATRELSMKETADTFKPSPATGAGEARTMEYRGHKITIPCQLRRPEPGLREVPFEGARGSDRGRTEGASGGCGYLRRIPRCAPTQFVLRLIQAVDNEVFIRGLATIFPVTKSESLGAPSLDNDVADPTWTGEITAASEDSTLSFGKRELTPSSAFKADQGFGKTSPRVRDGRGEPRHSAASLQARRCEGKRLS